MAKYMVVETIHENCLEKVYQRFHEQGRMLPEGLNYLDSWLEKEGNRCFQLMETDDINLFSQWTKNWRDLTQFEIIELEPKPAPNNGPDCAADA
ncbi:MAG: DUF3303 domain-containing protein [Candidatus Latescibacteria bacterium]|nr:DUF3303 domain-containing protein [Candidatus Latescibacterota bacterium]